MRLWRRSIRSIISPRGPPIQAATKMLKLFNERGRVSIERREAY
jgi:hypothetical protein